MNYLRLSGVFLQFCDHRFEALCIPDRIIAAIFHSFEHTFDNNDMYFNEIQSFLNCVRTGERNRANIDSNILTSKIMQGIYDSSEQDKEIVFAD